MSSFALSGALGGDSAAAIIAAAVGSRASASFALPTTASAAYAAPATSAILEAPAASAILEAPAASAIMESSAVAVAAAPAAAALPLDQYQLNVDPNPQLIRKKPAEKVQYTQQISLKFLKPPPPQQPGDIVIKQERDVQAAPAPPLLVRQKPPAPLGK